MERTKKSKVVNNLFPGKILGEFKLLKRVRSNPKDIPCKRKKWRVECSCGKQLTVPQYYLLRKPNPKTHCGCKIKTVKTLFNREYRIWIMMNVRCNDPRHVAYQNYGGRGISVASVWAKDNLEGFTNFLEHIGPAPTVTHTLDRIDVNGNYCPGNVRWATPKEQAQNKRKPVKAKELDNVST